MGITTAISAAIRMGGPLTMKAMIGRAREDPATIELDLMSSTSPEVCELWNGQGIIRIIGKPEVEQIVYVEDLRGLEGFKETYGLFTIEEALKENILREQSMYSSINDKKAWYECKLI